MKLTVAHTDHRGHAIEIARTRSRDGIDVVIVHGGDGTVNEVVNGILGDCGQPAPAGHARPSAWCPAARRTCSRAPLGISPDPIDGDEPTVDLLDAVPARRKPWRRIGLMDCGERWACSPRAWGWTATWWPPSRRSGTRAARSPRRATSRVAIREQCSPAPAREPTLTRGAARPRARCRRALRVRVELQPVDLCQHPADVDEPGTSFETGLGVFGVTSMNVSANLRLVGRMLSKRPKIEGAAVVRDDDAVGPGDGGPARGVPDRR